MPGYVELNWSQMPGGAGGMIAVGIDSYIRGSSYIVYLLTTDGSFVEVDGMPPLRNELK